MEIAFLGSIGQKHDSGTWESGSVNAPHTFSDARNKLSLPGRKMG
jgi:hypothetical protein